MADSVNEWTFCTEHRKAVDGGSCDECDGDRNLVQVVRRYYLDVAREQVAAMTTERNTWRMDAEANREEVRIRGDALAELRDQVRELMAEVEQLKRAVHPASVCIRPHVRPGHHPPCKAMLDQDAVCTCGQ